MARSNSASVIKRRPSAPTTFAAASKVRCLMTGLAAASFYLPYRGVQRWSWETYWLVGGVFSWIVAPVVLAWALVPGLWEALHATPARTLWWAYAFGVLWGMNEIFESGTP